MIPEIILAVLVGGWLPDRTLTPGAIVPLSAQQICWRGYARSVRHPYDAAWRRMRVFMFRRYGIPHEDWKLYTVDHLVPIEVGGAPFDGANLWPELKAEAVAKDQVEDAMHRDVCDGMRSLTDVQNGFERNWTTLNSDVGAATQ